jgi:hypothetical protein
MTYGTSDDMRIDRDGEVDDETRLAAVLAVLALMRGESLAVGGLAQWRAQRLAALADASEPLAPARPAPRARRS